MLKHYFQFDKELAYLKQYYNPYMYILHFHHLVNHVYDLNVSNDYDAFHKYL